MLSAAVSDAFCSSAVSSFVSFLTASTDFGASVVASELPSTLASELPSSTVAGGESVDSDGSFSSLTSWSFPSPSASSSSFSSPSSP